MTGCRCPKLAGRESNFKEKNLFPDTHLISNRVQGVSEVLSGEERRAAGQSMWVLIQQVWFTCGSDATHSNVRLRSCVMWRITGNIKQLKLNNVFHDLDDDTLVVLFPLFSLPFLSSLLYACGAVASG